MRFRAATIEDIRGMPDESQPMLTEDTTGIVAEDEKGVQAICVLDSWTRSACQIHIWIANPFVLKHGFAEEVFGFVFDSGRSKIIGLTPANNEKALKFIKNIGFEEVFRIEDGYDVGIDYVMTEITKDRCKFYGRQKAVRRKPKLRAI